MMLSLIVIISLFQLASSGMKKLLILIYICTFASMTPLGIAIGIGLKSANEEIEDPSVAILNGLAGGTLIYVVFFEVLEKERQKQSNGLFQVSF